MQKMVLALVAVIVIASVAMPVGAQPEQPKMSEPPADNSAQASAEAESNVSITGTIQKPNGEPFANRMVILFGHYNTYGTLTDSNGEFSKNVPSGTYVWVCTYQITESNMSNPYFEPKNGTTAFVKDDVPDFEFISSFEANTDISLGVRDLTKSKTLNIQTVNESDQPATSVLIDVAPADGYGGIANMNVNEYGWLKFPEAEKTGIDVAGPVEVEVKPTINRYDSTTYIHNPEMETDTSITVTLTENEFPTPDFDYSPKHINRNESITFKSTSTDPDGYIDGVYWDFDQNWSTNDTGSQTVHQFAENGTKTVRIAVYDDDGAYAELNETIVVGDVGDIDPIVGMNPPQDPDQDGMYEDVNGDGHVDFQDAIDLAFNLNDPNVQPQWFDFDADGDIDFDDAVTLAFE